MKKGLFLLFSLLIFILSCDNHFDMPQDIPAAKAGYGKVAVTINGASARTVFPTMAFAKYEYFFARVTNGTPGTPQAQAPVNGYFSLELGNWQLTVKAYAKADDTVPAATGVSATFAVTGGGVAQVAVHLNGNAETGEGKFVYTITYPAGAAISAFSLKNLQDNTVVTISASGASPLTGSREVSAGYYFLTIQLTEGGETGRTTGANEVVYVYDRLDSEYSKIFSADDFSHIHDWGSWESTAPTCMTAGWDTRTCSQNAGHKDTREGDPIVPDAHDWNTEYTTITAVTETENGIEAQTCKRNALHTQNPRCEYATGTAGLSFTFNYYYNEYSVSRGTATGAIHIPAYRLYDGNYLPVTEVGRFGENPYNTTVTGVTFAAESPFTSIANGAFNNCRSLTSINIPASVLSIGDGAFSNCRSLTGINIPASVLSIGDYVFYYCDSLTSITVDVNNPNYASHDGVLYNKAKTSILIAPEGISGSVTIPSGVTSIGNNAFNYCTGLTSIEIPASVTSIGNNAFNGCSSLTSIEIPSSVTTIGDFAFSGCSSLTSITIPVGVTSIGDAFQRCSSLTSITVDNANQNYASQDGILYNKAKTLIIKVPEGISGSVTIPNSVTSIGNGAFSGCTSLTSITIPTGVTSIFWGAFNGCSSLTSITIPAGVTSIGDYAFQSCSSLTSITVDANNQNYASQDGILYNKAKTSILIAPGGISGSVTIPASVTSIGDYAFQSCSSLTSVIIGEGVTTIGRWAFYGCSSLTSITIPSSVTTIGDWALAECTSLTSATIPASVTSIAPGAFYGWTSSQTIYIEGYASQAAADSAWNSSIWRDGCDAVIKYWNGSGWV